MRDYLSKYFKGDAVIWAIIVTLSIYSVLAVYSSTGTLAYKYQEGNTSYYLLKHFSLLLVGLGLTFLVHNIPYRYFRKLSQLLYYLSIPLLMFTLLMGTSRNDASRWLTLPGGISFQTSDLAKLALIMFLAHLLAKKQNEIKDFNKAFKPVFISVIVICALIFPANFSTAALIFLTSLIMMFVGRINIKYILGVLGIIIVSGGIFISLALSENLPEIWRFKTWEQRIITYVEGGDKDASYQSDQSKIAVATGGILGKGPGHSVQRNFLPHPYSDFIFAIIVEEYGLIFGAIPIIFLYLALLYRTGVIIRKTKSRFAAFLAIGLTTGLVIQAFINMGVAVGLMPVTGQTLPLVSMGGTSIFFTGISMGVILSVSRSYETENCKTDNIKP